MGAWGWGVTSFPKVLKRRKKGLREILMEGFLDPGSGREKVSKGYYVLELPKKGS